jgi:hypothetical protein
MVVDILSWYANEKKYNDIIKKPSQKAKNIKSTNLNT